MVSSLTQFFVALLLEYKYIVLFPVMIVEGPIITMVAGFLSSMSIMNPIVALPIIIVGDLAGDMIYYFIGRSGQRWWVTRWITKRLAFESAKDKMITLYRLRGGWLLLFGKLTHALGALFLIGAGYTGMGLGSFICYNFIGTVVKSSILLYIGYLAGNAYMLYAKYFEYGAIFLTAVALAVIYIVFRLMPRLSHQIFHIPTENPKEKP